MIGDNEAELSQRSLKRHCLEPGQRPRNPLPIGNDQDLALPRLWDGARQENVTLSARTITTGARRWRAEQGWLHRVAGAIAEFEDIVRKVNDLARSILTYEDPPVRQSGTKSLPNEQLGKLHALAFPY